ncbi:hypothetical protein [Aquimarina algicola]|uniref:Uncharacterized protein n=1 Tax=Aquimarina algicola TaxID=2589995 RepID=A0A504J7E7_9FLAO|nr:hypothetical protein [Aquimarina algicola]TPN84442.1 hypothetical protein FHK87_16040 [Aquimarina algicola]
MKKLKILFTTLLVFTITGIVAQNNKQIEKTKTTKIFNFKKDGNTVPYKITIYKTAESNVKLNEEDKKKVNQERIPSTQQVTKLIYVDSDEYDDYDKYIVLRYIKDAKDSFELKPTERGFMVLVDDKNMEYIFGEGVYFVNNEDKDFFYVDEFDSI